jgi:hypothetical protein
MASKTALVGRLLRHASNIPDMKKCSKCLQDTCAQLEHDPRFLFAAKRARLPQVLNTLMMLPWGATMRHPYR